MKNIDGIAILERKFRSIGIQMRWWSVIVFLVGVVMAILEANGGVVITALGFVMTLQGAIVQYVFRGEK